jgi:hypothetical protein
VSSRSGVLEPIGSELVVDESIASATPPVAIEHMGRGGSLLS